jgi:erythromycin esterase
MRRCIFGVWHTEELVPLFDYVTRTQTTARPLVLTGFDVQASTMQAASRPVFLRRVVAAIDSAYGRQVYSADSAFVAASFVGNQGNVAEAPDRLVAFYDSLATWLRTHERTLLSRFATDSTAPILARQTAVSMSVLVRVRAASGRERFELRDRGMADNLDFILDELHAGKKVIVWAHNSHVQHRGYGAARRPPSDSSPRSMGTYVAERHRAELYTVGLYMYSGTAALNTRTVYAVMPATTGSLESILHRAPWRYSFVDLSKPKRTRGTEWIFQKIPAKEWGVTPQLIVPRDEYDGILFVDRVWPPQYVR